MTTRSPKVRNYRPWISPLLAVSIALTATAGCISTDDAFNDPVTGERSGRLLYERRCGTCHSLFEPTAYTRAQWPPIVTEMARIAAIDERDSNLILGHLLRHTTDSAPTSKPGFLKIW